MPKRLKNKSKANVINSDRLDDFVNNNNHSYISTIAHIIIYEDKADIMRDDKFWGLEVINPTLKYSKGAAPICFVLD